MKALHGKMSSSRFASARPSCVNGVLHRNRRQAVLSHLLEDSARLVRKAVVVAAAAAAVAATVAATDDSGFLKFFFPQEGPVVISNQTTGLFFEELVFGFGVGLRGGRDR